MAVSKTLTYSGAISFLNWTIDSTIVSVTNEAINYPAKNLLNPIISKTYRTTKLFNEHNGYFQIGFDLGVDRTPTIAGIINSNITKTTGTGLYLIGSTSPDFSTSLTYYDGLSLYETKTRVLRWYLDTPTQNNGLAKRYWAFRFYPNDWGNGFTTDTFFQFGNFWLGEYQELRHDYGSSINQYDTSKKSMAFGGATYVDQNSSGYSLSTTMPWVNKSSRQSLISNYYTYRKNTHVLLDFEPFIDDNTSSVGGMNCFYGKIGDTVKSTMQFSGYANMQLNFKESVA